MNDITYRICGCRCRCHRRRRHLFILSFSQSVRTFCILHSIESNLLIFHRNSIASQRLTNCIRFRQSQKKQSLSPTNWKSNINSVELYRLQTILYGWLISGINLSAVSVSTSFHISSAHQMDTIVTLFISHEHRSIISNSFGFG